MEEPSKATVTKRNFKAELPKDFGILLSVKKAEKHLVHTNYFWDLPYIYPQEFEYFAIVNNEIRFSGSFSDWWIIRVFQKLYEHFSPTKYTIIYHAKK